MLERQRVGKRLMNRIFNNLRTAFGRAVRGRLRVRVRLLLVGCGLALMIVAPAVPAQKLQTLPPNSRKVHNVARSVPTDSAYAPAPREPTPHQPPPLPLTPEQTAPSPPRVSYEGGQLT